MLGQKFLSKFSSLIEHQTQFTKTDIFAIANNIKKKIDVYSKLSTPLGGVYQFSKLAGDLKRVKRAGWMQFQGLTNVESVADHSWRMALLCMLFSEEKNIDISKCMKFAIIHDLSEVIVGDITPRDDISAKEKHKLEDYGIKLIFATLSNEQLKNEFYDLWQEFEKKESIESLIVKDLDRYEMMLQAYEYEQMHSKVDLSEFFQNASKITHPKIKIWTQELLDIRNRNSVESNKTNL